VLSRICGVILAHTCDSCQCVCVRVYCLVHDLLWRPFLVAGYRLPDWTGPDLEVYLLHQFYRRYQYLNSSTPYIGTQTQFKVHSAPTDCMGSRNKYLICGDRDLNPGPPSALRGERSTVAPPKPTS
jgi:hypothetical protein